MGRPVTAASEDSYEAFVAARTDEFARFLTGVLGRGGRGAGGAVDVDDALQEALLDAFSRWGQLQGVDAQERERRMHRCLRDAAGRALRREYGRDRQRPPRSVPYDFSLLDSDLGDLSSAERELTASVWGVIAREVADDADQQVRPTVLDHAVLLAGLRVLGEQEAVALLAVDRLGWDQQALAQRLGIDIAKLRETLFTARRLFFGVIRHAVGVELDEHERATLHAYLAGDLVGRERRLARRHVRGCRSCQRLVREQRVFAKHAIAALPLPALVGLREAVSRGSVKTAAGTAAGPGGGLLGQAGAAKALVATALLLGTGVGTSAWLSTQRGESDATTSRQTSMAAVRAPTRLIKRTAARPQPSKPTASRSSPRHAPKRHKKKRSRTSLTQQRTPRSTVAPTNTYAAPSPAEHEAQRSSTRRSSPTAPPREEEFFAP